MPIVDYAEINEEAVLLPSATEVSLVGAWCVNALNTYDVSVTVSAETANGSEEQMAHSLVLYVDG